MSLAEPSYALASIRDGERTAAAIVAAGRAVRVDVIGERLAGAATLAGRSIAALLDAWDDVEAVVADAGLAIADDPDAWGDVAAPVAELDLAPPLVPTRLFAAAANYWGHIEELTVAQRPPGTEGLTEQECRALARAKLQSRLDTGSPYLFQGLPSAVTGPYDDVVLAADGERHDWEAELAVVFGRRARHVHRDDAASVIAGYVVCNDITIRDHVFTPDTEGIGADWLRAKSRATYFQLGPYLVPSRVVPDPMDLRIQLRVDGRLMQDSSTSDMLFDIGRQVE